VLLGVISGFLTGEKENSSLHSSWSAEAC